MERNEFLDKLASGKMTRRQFSRRLAAVGLAMTTIPLIPRAARAAEEATYFTWPGYDVSEIFQKYVEKHGALPNFSVFGDEEGAFAKLRAGYTPDVAHPCSYNTQLWRDAGLLQPIDTSRLSNWGDVFPQLKTLRGIQFEGEQWFAPSDWGNTSVLYRTDLVDIEEESWGLLWDERYKGRLAVLDVLEDAVLGAALYAGIDPFNMDDDDIARLRKVLEKQRPLLRFYTPDTTTIEQALASGEVVAAAAWNRSVVELKKQGLPVKFMNPKEGRITWVCGMVLHKNASQLDKAYDVIDSFLDPSSGQFIINEYGFGHSNRRSFDLVSEERLTELGFAKDPTPWLEGAVFTEVMKNRGKIAAMFEEVKAGF